MAFSHVNSDMNLRDIICKTRSYRRFDESQKIEIKTLTNLIDLARLSASGANRQPLKYLLCNTSEYCEKIFPTLAWAGYLADWQGPKEGERPSAYIIILGDREITDAFGVDHGIAAQSIMLGATTKGLGGCIIASIQKEKLKNELKISDRFEMLLVLALGKPIEDVVIEDVKDDNIRYWRDADDIHHVPKRRLEDIILKI